MFIHRATFWLRKDLTPAERQLFDTEVRRLARLPYLERGYVGIPAQTEHRSVTDHSFDYATSLHFKSLADHDHYQSSCPEHARFVMLCQGFWERVAVQDMTPLDGSVGVIAPRPAALNLFDLSGRTALVTGSSAGIGHALARGLAQAGARVILNARSLDKLAQAADSLRAEGIEVHTAAFDVTDAEAVTAAIAHIEAEIGAIDILVNNAGMQRRAPLDQFELAQWHVLMQTNLDSVFLVSQAVARHMIGRQRGKIINICSVQSELGRPGIAPYMASKGAVKMLTKGMAIDWGPHGLQVNGLGPGYFRTELTQALVDNAEFTAWLLNRTPARRWGDVKDLVGAAVFLASAASDFVNGHILYVDGGVTAQL